VKGLTPFEVRLTVGRLLGTQPHLRALAPIVNRDDLWRLCRDALQDRDINVDGWDIRPRWFGVVVVSTGRRGKVTGPSTIEWRTVADHLAAQVERRGLT
jgi:hypothetical protein